MNYHTLQQGLLKNTYRWGGVMDQAIGCLVHKHEGLNSVTRIHKKLGVVGYTWNPSTGKVEPA